jgi:hypothetical protein
MEQDEKPNKPNTIKSRYKNLIQHKQAHKYNRVTPEHHDSVSDFDPIAEEPSIDSDSPEHKKMVRLESIMSVGSEGVSQQITVTQSKKQQHHKVRTVSEDVLHVESMEESDSSKEGGAEGVQLVENEGSGKTRWVALTCFICFSICVLCCFSRVVLLYLNSRRRYVIVNVNVLILILFLSLLKLGTSPYTSPPSSLSPLVPAHP